MDDNAVQPTDNSGLYNPESSTPGQSKGNSRGIVIFIIVCALVALGGLGFGVYAMIDNHNKAQRIAELEAKSIENGTIAKSANDDGSIDLERIANDYGRVVSSVSSLTQALSSASSYFSDEYNVVLDRKNIEENDYFYGVHVVWEHKEDKSKYEEDVIAFKSDVFDYKIGSHTSTEGRKVYITRFNKIDKDTVKTVLDIMALAGSKQNQSFEWIGSEVEEDDDSFIYTAHYNETVHGDFGIDDETTEKGYTITVDKETGEMTGVSEYGDDEDYEDDE